MNIGIVGLGLMGGSAAKALKAYTRHRVYGAERNPSVLQKALAQQAIDAQLDDAALQSCGLLFLALYPRAAVAWMAEHAGGMAKGTTVVDFCGVKQAVVEAITPIAKQNGICYVGGHPMAGTEKTGYDGARGDLFQGASMILTPQEEGLLQRLGWLEGIFQEMGFSRVTLSTPERHDRIIAYTSQLAHVLSSAYVQSPIALEHDGFSAGSLRDMTRVAWLNETMWAELFMENRQFLAEETEALCSRLEQYAKLLRAGDEKGMQALLQQGRLQKEQMMNKETAAWNPF